MYRDTSRLCSDVTGRMYLVHLTLLHTVACLDIQVEGNVAFDVRVSSKGGKQKRFRQGWENGNHEQELVFKMMQVRQNVTVAPEVECTYQYPEKEQVNAVLSNMMNELTKVFVRANDFISGVETRREGRRQGITAKKAKKEGEERFLRRGVESRFKVVQKKQKAFFELIYANMTNDYRHFYNATAERVDRSGRDPCQHQDEVKQIWRDLLEHAQKTLKLAAHRCVEEYLRDQQVEPKSKVRARLGQYLMKELSKVRASQLEMLCDTYQLCYNDLL